MRVPKFLGRTFYFENNSHYLLTGAREHGPYATTRK